MVEILVVGATVFNRSHIEISIDVHATADGFFDGFFGAVFFEVVVFTDVGGDEASLEVSMDSAGGFGGGSPFFNGPGTAFFFAGSEKTFF